VSVVFNIGVNLMLVRALGFRGLALGTSASALFNALMLMWLLRRKLGGIDGRRVSLAFGKVLVASIFMAAVAWGGERWLEGVVPGSSLLVKLFRVGAGIGLGMGALALAARVLRIAEFDEALRAVTARVFPLKTRP
jgi:putative peptidoglycan lipid II flippase